MALVAQSELPSFERVREEGVHIVTPGDAVRSPRPDLRVGFLNLMPDAALQATERQFLRLVSSAADQADIWVYPFTVAPEHRSQDARWHIHHHYARWRSLRSEGLDALIVTGANPARNRLALEVFWDEMIEVLEWARSNVHSVVCSCLATHAVLKHHFGIDRYLLPQKRWGVYNHRPVEDHPLLADLGSSVDAPHSHQYEVSADQITSTAGRLLLVSDEAGAHMAVSADEFYIYFQGHPEYDEESLLKEYKREVGRFHRGERPDYPPFPTHYFDDTARILLDEYRDAVERSRANHVEAPPFPGDDVLGRHPDTWTDAGRVIYRNWLGEVQRHR